MSNITNIRAKIQFPYCQMVTFLVNISLIQNACPSWIKTEDFAGLKFFQRKCPRQTGIIEVLVALLAAMTGFLGDF
jgi:hypothetical protein